MRVLVFQPLTEFPGTFLGEMAGIEIQELEVVAGYDLKFIECFN